MPIIPDKNFFNVYKSYQVCITNPTNIDSQSNYAKTHIINCIANSYLVHGSIKMQLELNTIYHKAQDESYKTTGFFLTKFTEVYRSDELDIILNQMFLDINNRMKKFQKEGSGWFFEKIEC